MIQTPRVVGNRAVTRAVNGGGIGRLHLAAHITQPRPSWSEGEEGGMRRIERQLKYMLLSDQLILKAADGATLRVELLNLYRYGTHWRVFHQGSLYIWHHHTRPRKKGQPEPEKATPEIALTKLLGWLREQGVGLRAAEMQFKVAGAGISGSYTGEPIIMLGGIPDVKSAA